MRGKVPFCQMFTKFHRITPAYAGKRDCDRIEGICTQDHPRLCGEKLLPQSSIPAAAGSPPPMRGKAEESHQAFLPCGITPAYAGKSLLSAVTSATTRGSPPPMRGKGLHHDRLKFEPRITPAYAGKRIFEVFRYEHRWDHPRLCGEKRKSPKLRHFHRGSPPPMRGKA